MRLTCLTSVFLVILALPAFQAAGQALDPPIVTCVEIQPDGSAVINWVPTTDPDGEFVQYEVIYSVDYFLSDMGNLIGTETNLGATSYTESTIDFNAAIGAFYVQAISNDGSVQTSVPSDTVCAMVLDVTALDGGSVANLFWDSPYPDSTDPSVITGTYEVELEYPAGTFTTVSVQNHNPATFNQNFQYIVDDCEAEYTFRVYYNHPSGCQFISNTVTEQFEDLTPPDIPEVQVVTIDPMTGQYQVIWEPSPTLDTWGYIVYECIQGANVPLDTIYDANITTWNDPTGNPQILPANTNLYTVAAFDYCDFENVSPTEPFCHRPMHLLNINWTQCTDFAEVLWTPYTGRTVDAYQIHVSENGGAFSVLAVVPGTQLTYTHENLQDGVTYEYYIEATFTTTVESAVSNTRTQAVALAPPPAFTYLASVDVLAPDYVEVRVHTESIAMDHLYILERRKVGGQFWVNVDNQLSSNANNVVFADLEPDLKLHELEYDYRVHVLNTCGDTASTTNLGRNILLEGLANSERLVNTLAWEAYQEWDGAIEGYDIYRSETEGVLGTLIASLGPNAEVYEDDVADLLLTPGLFCYTVVAREEVNSFGIQEVASSNQLCLQMEPKIWIPNAFMVYGANPVFKPVIGFVDANSYAMQISSRWGDILFTTNDLDEGWDGTGRRGRVLPDGAYIYFITVKDGEGLQYERVGQVFLLKAGTE